MQYQALKKSSSLTLDDGILQNYYKSLSYLPCIRLSINVDEKAKDFVSIPDASVVLSSLTQEEAQKLLDGKITRISFQLKAVPHEISETAEKAVLSLLDQAVLMDSFRISVSKTVQTPGASNTYDWSLTEQPLTLRFSFSKVGQPVDGYERTFHIAALKDGSDGKTEAQLLETKTDGQTALTPNPLPSPEYSPSCIRTANPAEKPASPKFLPKPVQQKHLLKPSPAAVPLRTAPPTAVLPGRKSPTAALQGIRIPGIRIPGTRIPTATIPPITIRKMMIQVPTCRITKRSSGRRYAPSFRRRRQEKR